MCKKEKKNWSTSCSVDLSRLLVELTILQIPLPKASFPRVNPVDGELGPSVQGSSNREQLCKPPLKGKNPQGSLC